VDAETKAARAEIVEMVKKRILAEMNRQIDLNLFIPSPSPTNWTGQNRKKKECTVSCSDMN